MPRKFAFGGTPAHPDQPAHGGKLKRDIAQLRAIHAKRVPVLGVEPQNVVVLEFSAPPDQKALEAAGLRVLDWLDDRVVAVAEGDPTLAGLMRRVEEYETGPRPHTQDPAVEGPESDAPIDGEQPRPKTAPYQSLLDCIETVRSLGPDEVVTPSLQALMQTVDTQVPLLIDLQCWCPEDEGDARARFEATAEAVKAGGGRVLDRTLRHGSGLSLLRVEATPLLIAQLAVVPHIRRIDRLPRPTLSHLESIQLDPARLPAVLPPLEGAPTIAVIDSGVLSGHPLIGPAFAEALATAGLDGESDGSGHGTFVASLALYGSLESLLDAGQPLQPVARLVSVRVLDDNSHFPDVELWENHLLDAMALAVNAGARIINLSLGDERRPYSPMRPTPLAAAIDRFAREHDVVVIISAGNLTPGSHDLEAHDTNYLPRMLEMDDAGVLDPATSALALTVGALGGDDGQGFRMPRESVDAMPVGGPGRPSPLTRSGPGAAGMVKPEVVMPGGHVAFSALDGRPRLSPATGVLGAGGVSPSRLFAVDAGTSYAAPLVTHIAASALAGDAKRLIAIEGVVGV